MMGRTVFGHFASPAVASKHMTSFAYAAMGFILANLVISGIVCIINQHRLYHQVFGVVTAALVLDISAVFLTWISSCQNRFDDFHMIGSIVSFRSAYTRIRFMLLCLGHLQLLSVLSGPVIDPSTRAGGASRYGR